MVAEQNRGRPEDYPGYVIRLPAFSLPFPSRISPFAGALIAHTEEWVLSSGLVPSQDAAVRLRRSGIMTAGPRLAPGAAAGQARFVCDWTVWLIVLDDEFDDGAALGAEPARARAAIEEVVRAFRGQDPGSAGGTPLLGGVSAAAADLGRRAADLAPGPAWLDRFRRHAEEHIQSKVQEADLRAGSGGALDVPLYVALRRITSAAYTYADLTELAAQAAVPPHVRESAAWEHLLDAAADVWLGIQDICSAAKEVTAGDQLNLAAVKARESGTTLQQGVDAAYQWVCMRSEDLTGQRDRLRHLAPHGDAAGTGRYLDALGQLLGGHLAWNACGNPRYPQSIPAA